MSKFDEKRFALAHLYDDPATFSPADKERFHLGCEILIIDIPSRITDRVEFNRIDVTRLAHPTRVLLKCLLTVHPRSHADVEPGLLFDIMRTSPLPETFSFCAGERPSDVFGQMGVQV